HLLGHAQWSIVARLSARAFEAIGGEVVGVILFALNRRAPTNFTLVAGIDVAAEESAQAKAMAIRTSDIELINQFEQRSSPGGRFVVGAGTRFDKLLEDVAIVSEGLHTGDYPRFGRVFWEVPADAPGWVLHEAAAQREAFCTGKEYALFWENGNGALIRFVQE